MKPTSAAARIQYILDCGVPSIVNSDQKEQKGKRSSAKGKETLGDKKRR